MKAIQILLAALLFSISGFAQIDTSKKYQPVPAPQEFRQTTRFNLPVRMYNDTPRLRNADTNSVAILGLNWWVFKRIDGVYKWALASGAGGIGSVTSVGIQSTNGTIAVGGSPITGAGVLDVRLPVTGVAPGSYTAANITVDAFGRVVSAANGSAGALYTFNYPLIPVGNNIFFDSNYVKRINSSQIKIGADTISFSSGVTRLALNLAPEYWFSDIVGDTNTYTLDLEGWAQATLRSRVENDTLKIPNVNGDLDTLLSLKTDSQTIKKYLAVPGSEFPDFYDLAPVRIFSKPDFDSPQFYSKRLYLFDSLRNKNIVVGPFTYLGGLTVDSLNNMVAIGSGSPGVPNTWFGERYLTASNAYSSGLTLDSLPLAVWNLYNMNATGTNSWNTIGAAGRPLINAFKWYRVNQPDAATGLRGQSTNTFQSVAYYEITDSINFRNNPATPFRVAANVFYQQFNRNSLSLGRTMYKGGNSPLEAPVAINSHFTFPFNNSDSVRRVVLRGWFAHFSPSMQKGGSANNRDSADHVIDYLSGQGFNFGGMLRTHISFYSGNESLGGQRFSLYSVGANRKLYSEGQGIFGGDTTATAGFVINAKGRVRITTADSTSTPNNMLTLDRATGAVRVAAVPSGGGGGGVSNVGTGYGLTGGPITSTGTISADSLQLATIAQTQKRIDSLAATLKLSGTRAGRPSGVYAGQTYYQTDEYIGLYRWNGSVWVYAPDEYDLSYGHNGIGGFGTGVANGGTVDINSPSTFAVAANMTTGTGTAGRASIGGPRSQTPSGGYSVSYTRISTPVALSSPSDRYFLVAGIGKAAGKPVRGAYFIYCDSLNGGAFQCESTSTGSSYTTTNTSVTVAAATVYDLVILYTLSDVKFYINGTLVATHTTDVPTSYYDSFGGVGIEKTSGSNSRTVTLRYSRLKQFRNNQ